MSTQPRAFAQSQDLLDSRRTRIESSPFLASLAYEIIPPTPPTPVRRTRYLPELDMEIEIVEPPRKAIVNKDIRVRALRERLDEKEIRPTHPHSSRPRPLSPLRFELSARRM